MCTVSWVHVEGGYHLFCNRDERTTRGMGLPPAVRDVRGVTAIAPADRDFGGTWLGVNEAGVAVCLLNRYDVAPPVLAGGMTSRGLLVLDLLDSPSRMAVRERLSETVLERYLPFTLVALAPGEPALVARWNGRNCLFEYDGEFSNPLVSSSFDEAVVAASRRQQLALAVEEAGDLTPEVLAGFHQSHAPAPGPYSVCMHRHDASTVSFSHVVVSPERVELRYQDGPPCAGRRAERLAIPRAAVELETAGPRTG
jgi:hypothetical protein